MPNDPISKVRLPNNTTYDIHDSRIDSVTSLENSVSASYSDVKTMITNGTLVPGTWYRITDYVATTTDTESRSVNHPFDVIVMAESSNKLLEEGYAALHSGDTYFANNNLAAWKVWYSIDNDTTRFAWADTTNGKGVVYRLIDEYNNDVPYDFKSIQFKRYAVTAESTYTASIGQLNGLCIGQPNAKGFTLNTSTYEWYYTFTALGSTFSADKADGSLTGKAYDVVFSRSMQRNTLLNNVFANGTAVQTLVTQLGITLSDPDYTYVAANLTFADASYRLTVIGDMCNSEANETQMRENLFVGSVRHNVFKSDFQDNTIVGDYIFNTAQLSDNVIFVKDTMARVAIERLSENYIYTSGSFYNSKGISVTNNTFVISSGSDSSVFGTDFGVQFRNNTINGRFNGNSFQYNTTGNTFGANVLMCTFNTTQFSYNTINSPIVGCVFAGPVEYVDIPAVTDKNFAYVDSGALRGASDSHIKLGNSEFFVSVLTGLQRRIAIESNDDGQIVATWKDTDGVSTGVYATSAESRSDTWHDIPASDDDANVYVFDYTSWASDIEEGGLTIPLATYESMLADVRDGVAIIFRLRNLTTNSGVVQYGVVDDFHFTYHYTSIPGWETLVFFRWNDGHFNNIVLSREGDNIVHLRLNVWDTETIYNKVTSITGAGTSYQYPSTSAVVNYVAAHGGLPTPTYGEFLESDWDSASSSYKWKISNVLSHNSAYIEINHGGGIMSTGGFRTESGTHGNNSYFRLSSDGLVGKAEHNSAVFSGWSWIKYQSSYSPEQYVTLDRCVLPAPNSSNSGCIPFVTYDTPSWHWDYSPFYIISGILESSTYGGFRAWGTSGCIEMTSEQLYCSWANDWGWIRIPGSRVTYITLQDTLDTKQATLVSGTNIKTINNQSLLGSGNITISGGGTSVWEAGTGTTSVKVVDSLGTAGGNFSTVEGKGSVTGGNYTENTLTPDEGDTTSGSYSHAEGRYTIACGAAGSHAEGNRTLASGRMSHAEGNQNIASGSSSHVEGYRNMATGGSSHAEGQATKTVGTASHAENAFSNAVGNYTHAEIGNMFFVVSVTGAANATTYTVTTTDADVIDYYNELGSVYETILSNARIGKTQQVPETITQVTQINSISLQNNVLTMSLDVEKTLSDSALNNDGTYRMNTAMAYGVNSHSEAATSYGQQSHAEGESSIAIGRASHSEGKQTISRNTYEHSEGYYNVSNKASDTYGNAGNTQHSIGIGAAGARKNAFEVMQNGDVYVYGIGGYNGANVSQADSLQDVVGGGGSTSDCVHKTGDETVGGDKTFTDNIGVVDADHIVYSGGGGGGGFTRGYATIEVDDVDDISVQLANEPKAFIATAQFSGDNGNISMIAIIGDSTGCHCVYSAAGTHQHNYSSDNITASYSNGRFYLSSNGLFHDLAGGGVNLVYYYGEGTLTFKTSQIQPGSGVTAVTFTGTDLTEVPAMYAVMLETQVNNESYRRVAYYTNESGGASATPMGVSFFSSQIHNTTSSFTATYQTGYSAGLNINSGGTNAGGYFHNPGTYTLYYLMASDVAGGGGGGFQSLGDELDDIRDTIGDIATILASI